MSDINFEAFVYVCSSMGNLSSEIPGFSNMVSLYHYNYYAIHDGAVFNCEYHRFVCAYYRVVWARYLRTCSFGLNFLTHNH